VIPRTDPSLGLKDLTTNFFEAYPQKTGKDHTAKFIIGVGWNRRHPIVIVVVHFATLIFQVGI
jgi:hypothetical protein